MKPVHLKPEARRRLFELPEKHRAALGLLIDEIAEGRRNGKALENDLAGARGAGRGEFRVVFEDQGDLIVVHRIQHRAKVYRPR